MSKELDYIADLERENRLLGERCTQLLKDKGELTDKIADIKANCDLAIEGRDIKIKELEQQIEQMKCCYNCSKWYDGVCEESPKSKTFFCADFKCDKWEVKEND